MLVNQDRLSVLLSPHRLHHRLHRRLHRKQFGHMDVRVPHAALEQHLRLHVQPGAGRFLLRALATVPHLLLLQQNRLDFWRRLMQTAEVHLPCESLRKHPVPHVHQRAQILRRRASAQIAREAEKEERRSHRRARLVRSRGRHLSHPLLLTDRP